MATTEQGRSETIGLRCVHCNVVRVVLRARVVQALDEPCEACGGRGWDAAGDASQPKTVGSKTASAKTPSSNGACGSSGSMTMGPT